MWNIRNPYEGTSWMGRPHKSLWTCSSEKFHSRLVLDKNTHTYINTNWRRQFFISCRIVDIYYRNWKWPYEPCASLTQIWRIQYDCKYFTVILFVLKGIFKKIYLLFILYFVASHGKMLQRFYIFYINTCLKNFKILII